MSDDLRDDLRATMSELRSQETTSAETTSVEESVLSGDSGDAGAVAETAEATATADAGRDEGGVRQSVADAPASGRARDATGKFAKAESKASATPAPKAQAPSVTPVPKSVTLATPNPSNQTAAPQQGQTSITPRVPVAWKNEAKELWPQLPPAIQAEITKREWDVTTSLQHAKDNKAFRDHYNEAMAPLEPFLRSQGAPDSTSQIAMVRNVMSTIQELAYSPPQQKAQIIKRMIQSFQVPIDVLDGVLAEENPQNGPQQPQQQPYRDPRVDQLLAQIEHGKHRNETQARERIRTELSTFRDTHEFYDDVRHDMAALMDAAKARGSEITLEQAYNRAVRGSEELAPILEQRKAADSVQTRSADVQRAKAASSSVKSQPASGASSGGGDSLRDTLREALAESRRR